MGDTKKVALVTGGIGGIGTAICQRLARDGFQVVASFYPPLVAEAETWQKARAAEGWDVGIVSGDASSAPDSVRMVAAIEANFGPVQVLVNCAGVTRDRTMRKMTTEDWDTVLSTNLSSVFYVTKPVWDGMLERGFGRVINISSVNGQRGQFG